MKLDPKEYAKAVIVGLNIARKIGASEEETISEALELYRMSHMPKIDEKATWDHIFNILNSPDASMGTKEAMIREQYFAPRMKKI